MREKAMNRFQEHEGSRSQLIQGLRVEVKELLLKRPLDIILSTIGLILSPPLWLAIVLAIKLEDRGPVFYVQERWGRYKKKIKIYKFRTVVPDAEKKWGQKQAKENDPTITKVGKILRATTLDEMPQLLNVWKGQVSFVGPRVSNR